MNGSQTLQVTLGGLHTGWRESGSSRAETVLMLHSLGLDCEAFDGIRSALTSDWRIVSFDQRGHGRAAADQAKSLDELVDDACRAIDACNADTVHLVGHSMGGAVAALCAARSGKRVASLALIATPAAGHLAFSARGQAALYDGMEAAIDTTLERWFGAEPTSADAAAIDYARSTLRTMTPAGYAAAWGALAQFEGYASLATQLPRTALIAGSKDLSTPPAAMQTIAAAFPGTVPSFDRIDDAGHMLVLTNPATVAAKLHAHWRGALSGIES